MPDRNAEPEEMLAVGPTAPPDWLAEYHEDDHSIDALQEYVILPIFKVIQALSDTTLKEKFGEGSIIITPTQDLVCSKGDSFLFVPIFFFTEFCKWSDLKDKASIAVLERTFDPTSELCKKSRDPKKRIELYNPEDEQGFKYRYIEHMNFAGVIYGDHLLAGTPVIMGFQRGEFFKGRAFSSAITLRKIAGKRALLWSQVWEFTSTFRENASGKWYGIDYRNPESVSSYIRKDEASKFYALHKETSENFEKKRLVADRSEEELVEEDEGGSDF